MIDRQPSSPTKAQRGGAANTFDDRLLAEAMFAYERGGMQRVSMVRNDEPLRGDFESVLIQRAGALQAAQVLRPALERARRWLRLGCITLSILGMLVGLTLAAMLFAGGEGKPINFYWLLLVAFGVQVVALVLWLVFALVPGIGASAGWVGRCIVGLVDWLVARRASMRAMSAAVHAWATILRSRQLGRWGLGIATHLLWLCANVSFVIAALVLLSAKSYTFHWQTTILPDGVFVDMTRAIGWLPEQCGFETPTREQVAACGPGATQAALAEARTSWAALLIGCIVVYGVVPRATLLLISLAAWRVGRPRYRLDLNRYEAGYADIRPTVHAGARGVAAPDDPGLDEDIAALRAAPHTRVVQAKPQCAPMLIGLELPEQDIEAAGEMLPWSGVSRVDGRADRDSVFEQLEQQETEPRRVVIAVDLASTPDTGHASFMLEVAGRLTRKPFIILNSSQATEASGLTDESVAMRTNQWREMLSTAGIEDVDICTTNLRSPTGYTRWLLASESTNGAQVSQPARFVWWDRACEILEQFGGTPANRTGDEVDELIEACFATNAGDVHASASHAAMQQAQAVAKDVADRAQRATDAMQHPIRSAARNAIRSVIPQRGRADKTSDVASWLADRFALAVMLDLQGRCDAPLISEMTRRCAASAAKEDAQDMVQAWRDAYKRICTEEGIL